ncbi:MAG: DUF3048 domain-containing protein [Acidimicrobiia bacterium]|nr:DUF3048 domain-containing protein [Acidimicrobiia bacterium]MDH4308118.1 DUF3048 domain-containing protein [Acidimicrobiia bacterium]MDH5295487.1 DUF3048 domain-containing protein [Acidimicrobiia bacterium]
MRRTLIALVVLGLIGAACGNEDVVETTTSSSTTTTKATTTTTRATSTTTEDTRPRSPINGLPVDDAESLDRRVVALKVDNHPDARPQSGIQLADGIFEIRVEGSITRFMALFHNSDAEYLGPTRSGRPTDAKLIRPLEATLFISGAQGWVQRGIRNVGIEFFVEPPGMFRIPERRAPHNLYSNTVELRAFADEREVPDTPPPTALWEFGELSASSAPAAEIDVSFARGFVVTWSWNGSQWERSLNGDESNFQVDFETEPERITADTLVMIEGRFFTDGPGAGQSGSPVPSTDTVGTGRAFVAAEGKIVEGTWARENAEDPFVLTDLAGSPMLVPPGHPWISIVPDASGGDVTWR